jgi:hypothetical protein
LDKVIAETTNECSALEPSSERPLSWSGVTRQAGVEEGRERWRRVAVREISKGSKVLCYSPTEDWETIRGEKRDEM